MRQLGRRGQVGLRKVKIDVLQGDLAHHADGDPAHAEGDLADAYQRRGQGEQRGERHGEPLGLEGRDFFERRKGKSNSMLSFGNR